MTEPFRDMMYADSVNELAPARGESDSHAEERLETFADRQQTAEHAVIQMQTGVPALEIDVINLQTYERDEMPSSSPHTSWDAGPTLHAVDSTLKSEEAADKTIRSKMEVWDSERKAALDKFQTKVLIWAVAFLTVGLCSFAVGCFMKHRWVLPSSVTPEISSPPEPALLGDVIYSLSALNVPGALLISIASDNLNKLVSRRRFAAHIMATLFFSFTPSYCLAMRPYGACAVPIALLCCYYIWCYKHMLNMDPGYMLISEWFLCACLSLLVAFAIEHVYLAYTLDWWPGYASGIVVSISLIITPYWYHRLRHQGTTATRALWQSLFIVWGVAHGFEHIVDGLAPPPQWTYCGSNGIDWSQIFVGLVWIIIAILQLVNGAAFSGLAAKIFQDERRLQDSAFVAGLAAPQCPTPGDRYDIHDISTKTWHAGHVVSVQEREIEVKIARLGNVVTVNQPDREMTTEQLQHQALSTLSRMSGDKITQELLLSSRSERSEETYELGERCKPGQIDFFVSHSWVCAAQLTSYVDSHASCLSMTIP